MSKTWMAVRSRCPLRSRRRGCHAINGAGLPELRGASDLHGDDQTRLPFPCSSNPLDDLTRCGCSPQLAARSSGELPPAPAVRRWCVSGSTALDKAEDTRNASDFTGGVRLDCCQDAHGGCGDTRDESESLGVPERRAPPRSIMGNCFPAVPARAGTFSKIRTSAWRCPFLL